MGDRKQPSPPPGAPGYDGPPLNFRPLPPPAPPPKRYEGPCVTPSEPPDITSLLDRREAEVRAGLFADPRLPEPASSLPWKLGGANIYPRYKDWGYVVETRGPDVCGCNGDHHDGWQNARYIVVACNAFPGLVSTLTAVLHQMKHGEASDALDLGIFGDSTQDDLRWCRTQIEKALKSL